MAKFCFFTDPAKLAAQQPAQAFGAISADQFNVTDLHTAAGDAIAVAVCDGQLRVQEDGSGKLTLILKPDGQPPFDFPFVSYFLYKGVEPSSLLVGGKVPKEADADGKELAKVVWKTWEANDNPGDPDRTALGLHLEPPAADYADDQPLDRLFYDYPKEKPPVRVKAGDRLAKFSALFGFEIVVEQIDRPGLLKQARSLQTALTARPPGGSSANDAQTFLRRHDKEAVLGFVDPCAFWGSFFQSKLKASQLPNGQRTKGEDVYADILRGPGGENAAAFVNRNRAYLDLRDEHGHSLDYYKAAGGTFKLALAGGTPIIVDYYDPLPPRLGWPCCWIPGSAVPAMAGARYVQAEVGLPATDYARPLAYVSAGFGVDAGRRALRPLAARDRFIDRPAEPDGQYLQPTAIGLPLTGGTTAALAASYQKISHFKLPRPDAAGNPPPRAADPANLAPVPLSAREHVLPLTAALELPANGSGAAVRTFAELFLLVPSSDTASVAVARAGFAHQDANSFLFLFPVARCLRAESRRAPAAAPATPPGLQWVADFLADFVPDDTQGPLMTATVNPGWGGAATPVQVVRGGAPDSDFVLIIVARAAFDAAMPAPNASTRVIEGTAMLSLTVSSTRLDGDGRAYVEAIATCSRLLAPIAPGAGATIVRQSFQPFPLLYGHADH